MPSPIGHGLSGLTLYVLARKKEKAAGSKLPAISLVILLSVLPDLDLIPGLMMGDSSLWHHRYTHSLFFAVVVSVCILSAAVLIRGTSKQVFRWALMAAGLILLHVGVDLITVDEIPPLGLQLLWPFSNAYYLAPWAVFDKVQRDPLSFSMLKVWILLAVKESLFFGAALTGALIWRRNEPNRHRKQRRT